MTKKLLMTTAIAAVFSFSQPGWAQDAGWVQRIHIAGYGTRPDSSRVQVYPSNTVVMHEIMETARRGAMELELRDHSLFTLGPSAKVVIDEFVFDPDSSAGTKTVSLVQGALRYVSGEMDRKGVTLRTRTATMGIRGTILLLNIARSGNETISVVAGATRLVLRSGETIDLNEGQSYLIDSQGNGIGVVDQVVQTPSAAVNGGLDEVDDTGDDEPDGSGGGEGGRG